MRQEEQLVYVVLVNFNGWRDTLECVESLRAMGSAKLRILVVDNASSDGSADQLKRWAAEVGVELETLVAEAAWPSSKGTDLGSFTLIESLANRGFSGGNNLAMSLLQSRELSGFVWLLNNDMIAEPGSLEALSRVAQDEGVGAVGAILLEYDQPNVVQAIAGGSVSHWHGMTSMLGAGMTRDRVPQHIMPVDFVSGGCLFTRTDVIAKVGLLDEGYFLYTEDVDWCERMRAAGYRVTYSVDARVRHKGGRSAAPQSAVHDYHIVRSSLRFVLRHARAYLPFAFAYSLYRCLLPKVVRGEWTRVRSVLRAYADYAGGFRRAASTST